MQGPLPASPPSMSPSAFVGEIQVPAYKRLKTSLNGYQDDDEAPVVPVDDLVTYDRAYI